MSGNEKNNINRLLADREQVVAEDHDEGVEDGAAFVTDECDYRRIRYFVEDARLPSSERQATSVRDRLLDHDGMREWAEEHERGKGTEGCMIWPAYWKGFERGVIDAWACIRSKVGSI